MGLKVLLADDSSAIKKVVQLCLQDFGVELKSTGNGKDVLDLLKQFKPDIALIDVMLPHRPGFDVASEIKNDPLFKSTPVIMLWSSFMEFDEAKYKATGADGRLEKPFEAKDLREIVKKLVPKAQANPFLDLIDLPKIEIPKPESTGTLSGIQVTTRPKIEITTVSKSAPTESPPELPLEAKPELTQGSNNPDVEAWSMSSFMDIGKFSQNLGTGDSEWVRKDLGKFNVDVQEGELPTAATSETLSENLNTGSILKSKVTESPQSFSASFSGANSDELRALLEHQIQKLVEKEARAILEKAIWKIVPDMATDLIKEEIKRLTEA